MRLSFTLVVFAKWPAKRLQVKKADTDKDMAVDLKHLEQLIDGNTVAIVGRQSCWMQSLIRGTARCRSGSCCQYAHGTIDPIEAMGKAPAIQLQRKATTSDRESS